MRKIEKCRTCQAEIVWTTTRKGKRMPVDAEPVPYGKFALAEGEDGVLKADWLGRTKYTGERYQSHFDTCTEKRWKKR